MGQSSGNAILYSWQQSEAVSQIPVRTQRACNDVAISTENTLAVGLEKVRNDSCLVIWDINHQKTETGSTPLTQFAPSEAISSMAYFPDTPQLLLAGVAYRNLRIFDVRDASQQQLSIPTKSVYSITINPQDPNYFASHADDGTVNVYDKRSIRHSDQSVLMFAKGGNAEDSVARTSIAGIGFSSRSFSSLGVLMRNGHFNSWDMQSVDLSLANSSTTQIKPRGSSSNNNNKSKYRRGTESTGHTLGITRQNHLGMDNNPLAFDWIHNVEHPSRRQVVYLTRDGSLHCSKALPDTTVMDISCWDDISISHAVRHASFPARPAGNASGRCAKVGTSSIKPAIRPCVVPTGRRR